MDQIAPAELTLKFLQAARRIHTKISEKLAPLDTTLQQLKVLSLLQENPEQVLTVNAIRENMMDPMSNVSRLLNKMVAKGLIRKSRETDDQRVVQVSMTVIGYDLYCRGGDVLSTCFTQLNALDEQQRRSLVQLLAAIED